MLAASAHSEHWYLVLSEQIFEVFCVVGAGGTAGELEWADAALPHGRAAEADAASAGHAADGADV